MLKPLNDTPDLSSQPTRSKGPPEKHRKLEVYNPCTETWITGVCTGYLSTQWTMVSPEFSRHLEFIIHSNWKWRYL